MAQGVSSEHSLSTNRWNCKGDRLLNDETRTDIGDLSLESSRSSSTAEQISDKGQDTVEMAKNAAGQAGQKSKNFMNQQIDQRSTQAGERVRADCRERTRAGARARLEHQGESAGRFRELKATFAQPSSRSFLLVEWASPFGPGFCFHSARARDHG